MVVEELVVGGWDCAKTVVEVDPSHGLMVAVKEPRGRSLLFENGSFIPRITKKDTQRRG